MSNGGDGNKTVFRPSPLQGLRQSQSQGPAQPPPAAAFPPPPPPVGQPYAPPPMAAAPPPPMAVQEDVPPPARPVERRNLILSEAASLLALAASVRTGRAQIPLPQLHGRASQAIAALDGKLRQAGYPEETINRAKYALCSTLDDIAQNLGGPDGAEWARRSLVVQFFSENIGGERFWQLLEAMLASPDGNYDLLELYHACMAAGFEGRFRVMPDGKRAHHELMARAFAALPHGRTVSPIEVAPRWKGAPTPARRPSFLAPLLLAAGAAGVVVFLVWLVLRLILVQTGQPALAALRGVNPDQPLRLSRVAPAPPVEPSTQLQRVSTFLQSEIDRKLVAVEQDASSIRVRTTVGQLFQSGSDALEPGRAELFGRIAASLNGEPGAIRVEGHADSDRPSGLTFPDNTALSAARAETVAALLRQRLQDPSRVTAEGFGDAQPIASNATPGGKALNRRVEVVIPRSE